MKLVILAVGRMKAGPERELLRRYAERCGPLSRNLGLAALQVMEIDESRARSPESRKREEAAAIIAHLSPGAALILLDERGDDLESVAFAARLATARDAAIPGLIFVIGGPDGLDPALLASHRALRFGRATFPHQLVRVLLAEQIYRALTILAGHPYHRV